MDGFLQKNNWRTDCKINKNLHYGHTADLFAYAMFCLLIAPAWVKKNRV